MLVAPLVTPFESVVPLASRTVPGFPLARFAVAAADLTDGPVVPGVVEPVVSTVVVVESVAGVVVGGLTGAAAITDTISPERWSSASGSVKVSGEVVAIVRISSFDSPGLITTFCPGENHSAGDSVPTVAALGARSTTPADPADAAPSSEVWGIKSSTGMSASAMGVHPAAALQLSRWFQPARATTAPALVENR